MSPLQTNNLVTMPIQRAHTRSVEFPKTPNFNLLLINASLRQSLNTHDILYLKFAQKINSNNLTVASYDPVIFKWSSGYATGIFTGYVHNITPTTTTDNYTEITCISASYDLKDTAQKIYKDVTADQVVKQIAAKYGYKAITQRHAKVYKSIVQAGQSDWQILRRLALDTGFNLKVENTTIYFLSKDKMANTGKASAPYFYSSSENEYSRIAGNLGTIYDFDPIITDDSPDLPGVSVDRVVSGFHQITGETISTTHETNIATRNNLGVVVPGEDFFQ